MTPKTYPRLSVENFGPIKSGTVELKPLTIFIGPNNSGKSYMATLAYALYRALSPRTRTISPEPFLPRIYSDPPQTASSNAMQWLQQMHPRSAQAIQFEDFPVSVQEMLLVDSRKVAQLLSRDIERAIGDYFAVQQLHHLTREGNEPNQKLVIRLQGANEDEVAGTSTDEHGSGSISMNLSEPQLDGRTFFANADSDSRHRGWPKEKDAAIYYREWLLQELWMQLRSENGLSLVEPYYLPAARSGILQGYQAFAAIAFTAVRWNIGREAISIPAYQGVTGDFFAELTRKVPPTPGQMQGQRMASALSYLEERVFQGRVKLEATPANQPQISYTFGSTSLPIDRVSSMVAELAPFALWISDLMPGDTLFIDEPEAHLHPANQRHVATVLARLVNAGVHVVATTHSSLILHQISNHLIASKLPAAKRAELGYTDDDVLSADEVAVYLFSLEDEGTVIRPVDIDPEFGIEEEEFVRVSQAIGNETYYLSVAAREEADTTLVHP